MVNITSGYYDLTNITNSGNLIEFVGHVNDLTGQFLMLGILIAGFFILFLSTLKWGVKTALASSSFITGVMSVFFLILEYINLSFFLLIIIPAGIVYTITILKNEPY